MARNRWTLALIIICLPILATVITAFRIRDLPKSHESSKLETKAQTCENCDVKVGYKVHSIKIESDKHKHEDLKKTAQEQKQLINDKASETKLTHKFAVYSDEDDDDEDDDLEYSTTKTALKQEDPKGIKKSQSDSNSNYKLRVITTSFGITENDNDDDNDEDDDDNFNSKNTKSKKPEIKTPLEQSNIKTKRSPQDLRKRDSKILKQQTKKQKDESDEKDDVENDEYTGLENLDELFKILDMKPGSKLKKESSGSDLKTTHHMEIKTETLKKTNDMRNNNNEENDDENGDDDEEDSENKLVKTINKPPIKLVPSKKTNQKSDFNEKKTEDELKRGTIKQEQNNEPQSLLVDAKDKNKDLIKKSTTKDIIHTEKENDNLKSKFKTQSESKLLDPVKKEEKLSVNTKKDDHHKVKDEKEIGSKMEKLPKVIKKEEEKIKNSAADDKPSLNSERNTKEPEKDIVKPKPQEKDIKISSQVNKKTVTESKKDQTSHNDIFKTPEHKNDIKYDFEKPNAYKDSHKTFDYSEFEKIQATKTHTKEKKKPKESAETASDSREEKYLKHVTDALNRRNLMKSEFEDFYAFFPTFAPNFSRIHNPECRRHGQILLRQLRGTKLWALNMLDATAKIPSGVLQGNGIQLGDFDQCLESRARVQLDTGSVVKVQGKYCLARMELKAEHPELEAPVYLAQAKSLIKSRIDDPGHFVPRFSTLSWGVCVPAACDREDVEVIVKDALKHYQHKSGLVVKIKVDEDDCHTDEEVNWEEWLEIPTVLTLSFYGVILLLVLVATAQDFIARRQSEEETDEKAETDPRDDDNKADTVKQPDGILSPFSLYRTISKLIAPGSTDEISCIHGIRAIATIALLVAHKFMPIAVMPYTNRLKITETASSPLWSWCRAGWVFTDCFLLLSGTLTAHRISSDDTGAVKRLFSRYLRLTPALLAVVLFYAYIWDKLSTGPMWGTSVTKNAKICQQNWWWNLLYLQNYFGLEDMCAPQTHQLALDMQLTILGGVIVWGIQSDLGYSKVILPAVHLVSAYFRYTTVRDHRLTMLAYHGVSVSQLYRTARLSYTSTLHRCSPYLIGISLGLALQKPSKLGKFVIILGWLTSLALSALVVWSGLDAGSPQYRYSATFAAQYATIAPVASAMAIAWVIYAVHNGTCDFLSRALCWRPLVFISRISYALYLTQFIIFITNIGTVRTAKEFTLISLIDVQEISAITLSAVVLTVTFVIPMQSLHKAFSFQWKSETEEPPAIKKEEFEQEELKYQEEQKNDEIKETTHQVKNRLNLVAHREMLEEIPEMEVEYETQRESTEGLDEIIEEEEEDGAIGEEEDQINDLEIIEEEEAGEEDAWPEREGQRPYSRQDDQDLDEWEWTANGSRRSGAQYYRYAR